MTERLWKTAEERREPPTPRRLNILEEIRNHAYAIIRDNQLTEAEWKARLDVTLYEAFKKGWLKGAEIHFDKTHEGWRKG